MSNAKSINGEPCLPQYKLIWKITLLVTSVPECFWQCFDVLAKTAYHDQFWAIPTIQPYERMNWIFPLEEVCNKDQRLAALQVENTQIKLS